MTVPANFDQRQKAATMEAARLAGLKVIKLISEPAAAAVAYEMTNNSRKKILIYDFGGGRLCHFSFSQFNSNAIRIGTFDVAIARSAGLGNLEILSSSGHKHLGIDISNFSKVHLLLRRPRYRSTTDEICNQ